VDAVGHAGVDANAVPNAIAIPNAAATNAAAVPNAIAIPKAAATNAIAIPNAAVILVQNAAVDAAVNYLVNIYNLLLIYIYICRHQK
jgi:hypothetical protein